MPNAAASAVRKQIAALSADPIYLLTGEDEVEKAALAHEFEELVDEGLRAFNVERVHAGEWTTGDRMVTGVSSLVDAAKTLPMMAPRRVVIVLRAEMLLAPRRESEAAGRALEAFEALVSHPEPQTTLVLVASSIDRRSRIYKLLAKAATLVECGVLESGADAERWVRNRVSAAKAQIDPAGARLLAERCGTDVKRLRNDVDRLLLYTLGQSSISLDDVKQIVGPAALQDDWAMANAIESGDPANALRQLALMLDAGSAPEQVLGQLGWLVRTKFAGRVAEAVESVFRTDRELKTSLGEPRVLLERLVVELCAARRGGASPPAWGGR
jgi:DNA polymerase-3 subunit delta